MYDLYSGLTSRDTLEDHYRKNNGRLPEGAIGGGSKPTNKRHTDKINKELPGTCTGLNAKK